VNILLAILFLFIERAILDIAIQTNILGIFAPYTLVLNPNLELWWPSIIALILVTGSLPRTRLHPSSLIVWLFVAILFVPLTSIYWLTNGSTEWLCINTGFWVGTNLLLRIRLPRIKIHGADFPIWILYLLMAALFIAIAVVAYRAGTLGFDINLDSAYVIRNKFYGLGVSGIAYLTNALGLVIIPLVTLRGLEKKSFTMFLSGLVLAAFLYSFAGQKGYLFAPFLALGFLYLDGRKARYLHLTAGMDGLLAVSWFLALVSVSIWFIALVMNRALVLPAVISFYYFDYFSKLPPLLFAHGSFGFLFDTQSKLSPAYLIGQHYFHDVHNYANTGLIADAYMNYGITGVALTAVMFCLLLVFLDEYYEKLQPAYFYGLFAMPILFVINAPLPTVVMTGGLAFSIAIAWMMAKQFERVQRPQVITNYNNRQVDIHD